MSYKNYSIKEITDSVQDHTGTIIKETTTGALVFTEFGARLIGLFPSRDEPNTLWVATDIQNRIKNHSWITGGERLWIAPQRDFFFEKPLTFDGFVVSEEIDPGKFRHQGVLSYQNIFSLTDYRRNQIYNKSIAKRAFSIINDPYGSDLPFAGVKISEHLTIPASFIDICPWSITQVTTCGPSQPGTALFPTKKGSSLMKYFGTTEADCSTVDKGYARFKIDSQKACKQAVRPEDIVWENPAKVVYLSKYPESSTWFCLVKRSDDLPRNQSECVDVTPEDPEGEKGATQVYNNTYDPADYQPYGEIELQLKKGVTLNGLTKSDANHELLGYTGTRDELLKLAQQILQIDELPVIY